MLIIEFSKYGIYLRDDRTESWVSSVIEDYNSNYRDKEKLINVSNSLIISYFRLAVKEGLIGIENIKFLYKGNYLECDNNGRLDCYPEGFCDHLDKLLDKMLWGNIE